jgi:hypothetical protein
VYQAHHDIEFLFSRVMAQGLHSGPQFFGINGATVCRHRHDFRADGLLMIA